MDEQAKKLYNLNKRSLEYKNSKEYFVGDRICRYMGLLKRGKMLSFFKLLCNNVWRVTYKKKSNPIVYSVNLEDSYNGEKIAVYTAVFGSYDQLLEPLYKDPHCDYFIFTDQSIPEESIWKKISFKKFPKEADTDVLKNRYIKFFPQELMPQYKYSIYIDGNIQITSEISVLFKPFRCKTGIGMHKHPSNINLYEEVKHNLQLGKINSEDRKAITRIYRRYNIPADFGMFECNVIMRDHQNEYCKYIMKNWWNELVSGIKRDQLYFTYVLFKLGYLFNDVYLIGENINANPMFIRYEHAKGGTAIL